MQSYSKSFKGILGKQELGVQISCPNQEPSPYSLFCICFCSQLLCERYSQEARQKLPTCYLTVAQIYLKLQMMMCLSVWMHPQWGVEVHPCCGSNSKLGRSLWKRCVHTPAYYCCAHPVPSPCLLLYLQKSTVYKQSRWGSSMAQNPCLFPLCLTFPASLGRGSLEKGWQQWQCRAACCPIFFESGGYGFSRWMLSLHLPHLPLFLICFKGQSPRNTMSCSWCGCFPEMQEIFTFHMGEIPK